MACKTYEAEMARRAKISASCKGRKVSEYTKRRASETHKGKVISDETKAKMSEAKIKRVRCENIETGEEYVFSSVNDCSRFLGYKPDTIRCKCRANGIINGWRLNYEK